MVAMFFQPGFISKNAYVKQINFREWFTANAFNPAADCLKISEIDENVVMTQSSCDQLNGVMCEKSMTSTKLLGCPGRVSEIPRSVLQKRIGFGQLVPSCRDLRRIEQ